MPRASETMYDLFCERRTVIVSVAEDDLCPVIEALRPSTSLSADAAGVEKLNSVCQDLSAVYLSIRKSDLASSKVSGKCLY